MAIPHAEKVILTTAAGSHIPSILSALDDADDNDLSAAASVDDLEQTISATYDQEEVQAISDKVDELLAAMRTAGLMSS